MLTPWPRVPLHPSPDLIGIGIRCTRSPFRPPGGALRYSLRAKEGCGDGRVYVSAEHAKRNEAGKTGSINFVSSNPQILASSNFLT